MFNISLVNRIKNSWNAFFNKDPTFPNHYDYSGGSYYKPDRIRLTRGNERSTVTSVFNRIALDVASISINHCRLDNNKRFKEIIDSNLNNCLSLEANIDQTSRALIQDVVMSMFDEGCVAIVPIDTIGNPEESTSYEILTLRTGKIVAWFPNHIRVRIYNDKTGKEEEISVLKRNAAIIENPLYAVMNEPNSTLQRLI